MLVAKHGQMARKKTSHPTTNNYIKVVNITRGVLTDKFFFFGPGGFRSAFASAKLYAEPRDRICIYEPVPESRLRTVGEPLFSVVE